ncbi:hypothetical protein HYQ46_001638 [Verticillium longisporum]|nr:hypothetical protein HYQ46_001638 [Verticillium longisporum]
MLCKPKRLRCPAQRTRLSSAWVHSFSLKVPLVQKAVPALSPNIPIIDRHVATTARSGAAPEPPCSINSRACRSLEPPPEDV